MTITLITDEAHTVEGRIDTSGDGPRVVVPVVDLPTATGWVLKPEGFCRGDVCIPVRDRTDLVEGTGDERVVDLGRLAAATGQPLVIDPDEAVVALGPSLAERSGLHAGDRAPDFSLAGVDRPPVTLDEFQGRKKLVITWSSWCGCRYELPAWQQHYEALRDFNFEIIAVAIDDNIDAARPFVEEAAPTYACAVDTEQQLVERYGILNVPSAIWIDEDDRVVRTPDLAYGDRTWFDAHGVEPEPHLDALRAWVTEDRLPEGDIAREERPPPSEDDVLARLHFRIGSHLHRAGRDDAAERHFSTACELAPYDWTIRRASLPLRGRDPFGPDFLTFWQEWKEAGEPLY